MVRRISHIASSNNVSPDQVIKSLQKNNGLDNLRNSILLGKALDVLVEHATITYSDTAPLVEDETA